MSFWEVSHEEIFGFVLVRPLGVGKTPPYKVFVKTVGTLMSSHHLHTSPLTHQTDLKSSTSRQRCWPLLAKPWGEGISPRGGFTSIFLSGNTRCMLSYHTNQAKKIFVGSPNFHGISQRFIDSPNSSQVKHHMPCARI